MADQSVASISYSNSKPVIPGKISWKGGPSIQQNFSLPSSIIYYISKNPSTSTAYLKLVQSCKYFFEKLPVIIANRFDEQKLCSNDFKECFKNKQKCCVDIDLNKISSKIWFTDSIYVNQKKDPNFISLLCSKLYKSEVSRLRIYAQKILFNDFKMIATSAESVYLHKVTIVYDDGNAVIVDKILEDLPNIISCVLYPSYFNPSTLKNIAKLKNLSNLRLLILDDIQQGENVENIVSVIKEHKDIPILLNFNDNISDESKNRLDAIIDTVSKNASSKCLIKYNGQGDEKLEIMKKQYLGY